MVEKQGAEPDAGKVVFDLSSGEAALIVNRARFLEELLKPVPREVMHAGRKLVDVTKAGGSLVLHFEDGTSETAGGLIAADGIHSIVRNHILGNQNPAASPAFAGWWDCRNLVPFDKAKSRLGEQCFQEARQYCWVGDGTFIMHDILDDGKTVQCVGAVRTEDDWKSDEWKRELNRDMLEKAYKGWTDKAFADAMIEVS